MHAATFAAAPKCSNATMQALSASFVVLIFFLPPVVEPAGKALSREIKVSTGNNSCQRTMVLLLFHPRFVNRRQPIQVSPQMSSRRIEVQLLHLARNRADLSIFH